MWNYACTALCSFSAECSALRVCLIQTDTFLVWCHWRVEEPSCWGVEVSKKDNNCRKTLTKKTNRKHRPLPLNLFSARTWKHPLFTWFYADCKIYSCFSRAYEWQMKSSCSFFIWFAETKSLILKKYKYIKLNRANLRLCWGDRVQKQPVLLHRSDLRVSTCVLRHTGSWSCINSQSRYSAQPQTCRSTWTVTAVAIDSG